MQKRVISKAWLDVCYGVYFFPLLLFYVVSFDSCGVCSLQFPLIFLCAMDLVVLVNLMYLFVSSSHAFVCRGKFEKALVPSIFLEETSLLAQKDSSDSLSSHLDALFYDQF